MLTKAAQHAMPGNQKQPTPAMRNWWIAAALFLLTLLLFLPTTRDEFIGFDDQKYITENQHVLTGVSLANALWAVSTLYCDNWQPTTWLSHQLDCSIFGPGPVGSHLVSALLHSVNTALLFLFLLEATGRRWPSAACAALFAWHPLRVESVAWAAERKDVLCACFFFVTLLCYVRYARRYGGRWRWYSLALASFLLGLAAKPMLVTLPCLLLLLDYWPLHRLGKSRGVDHWRLIAEKAPFFVLAIAISVVTYIAQKAGGALSPLEGKFSLESRLISATVSYARYIQKMAVPINLSVFYPIPPRWPTSAVAASIVVLVALTAVAFWQARRRPYLVVGWLWFAGMLVPVINFVQVGQQSIDDRFTYLPGIGLTMAVCWLAAEIVCSQKRLTPMIASAAVMALAVLAGLTWRQIGYWHDDFALFSHAAQVTENNWVADGHIAAGLEKQGRFNEAAALLRSALLIHPKNPAAKDELGNLLIRDGRDDDAAELFAAAIEDQPSYLLPHYSLGNVLLRKGRFSEAAQQYRLYLAGTPDDLKAINNLAIALLKTNDLAGAQTEFEKCVQLDPASGDAECSLGRVLIMRGDLPDAATHYQRALTLDPQSVKAQNGLAEIQARMQQRQ
jgi:tetratricopeptide (TPR) repeat protein